VIHRVIVIVRLVSVPCFTRSSFCAPVRWLEFAA
jgi:hypothetical protein